MDYSNIVSKIFIEAFQEVKDIPFDPEWKNGTGYFDGAVKVQLDPGDIRRCIDDKNRRMLLVGTRFGTVVVFERYTGSDSVFVSNTPNKKIIRELIPDGAIGERAMSVITGGWDINNNIGFLIEKMINELSNQEMEEDHETV